MDELVNVRTTPLPSICGVVEWQMPYNRIVRGWWLMCIFERVSPHSQLLPFVRLINVILDLIDWFRCRIRIYTYIYKCLRKYMCVEKYMCNYLFYIRYCNRQILTVFKWVCVYASMCASRNTYRLINTRLQMCWLGWLVLWHVNTLWII